MPSKLTNFLLHELKSTWKHRRDYLKLSVRKKNIEFKNNIVIYRPIFLNIGNYSCDIVLYTTFIYINNKQ